MSKKELESLKCGDIVYLRMKVSSFYGKEYDSDIGFLLDFPGCCGGTIHRFSKRWLHLSIIPERAPKYDPCRLLRKGDKVQVKKRDGRCNGKAGEYLREAFCTVAEDETQNELVRVLHNATEYRLDPAYLELVTPVEEMAPYEVECDDDDKEYSVTIRNKFVCTYPYDSDSFYTKEQAKAAAVAACNRLNAEYREEMEK